MDDLIVQLRAVDIIYALSSQHDVNTVDSDEVYSRTGFPTPRLWSDAGKFGNFCLEIAPILTHFL